MAIIAILAAIAVPNFLEAQTRAQVSRVKADHRSLETAIESYRVDNNKVPPAWADMGRAGLSLRFPDQMFVKWALVYLTTPIAYMTSLPDTPFRTDGYRHSGGILPIPYNAGSEYNHEPGWYNNTNVLIHQGIHKLPSYHLRDPGPDKHFNNQSIVDLNNGATSLQTYDPSNGTVSEGDIWKYGN